MNVIQGKDLSIKNYFSRAIPGLFSKVSPGLSGCYSLLPPTCPVAERGLSEQHQNEVINYMCFACSKRGLRPRTVDSCFQDLKESRLVEETFTTDEVSKVLNRLQAVCTGSWRLSPSTRPAPTCYPAAAFLTS